MTWLLVIVLVIGGLALSAFFSGAETGLYCVNRLRLHLGAQLQDPRAVRLAGTLDDEHGALSVTLVGTNMANYVLTSAAAYLLAETMERKSWCQAPAVSVNGESPSVVMMLPTTTMVWSAAAGAIRQP